MTSNSMFLNNIYKVHPNFFEALDELAQNNKPNIIAIDGRCASGKSTLASLLGEKYVCNIFHMDDFYLPFEMRTKERLDEPGGNIHYERFEEEVLKPLKKRQPIDYRPFQCSSGALGEPRRLEYRNLNIVEGAYCLNPKLPVEYDYKIFLTVDAEVQKERIRKRNGKANAQNFYNKWIPLEEKYFSSFNIQDICDLVMDTTYMWD
jgi:uridine kinase